MLHQRLESTNKTNHLTDDVYSTYSSDDGRRGNMGRLSCSGSCSLFSSASTFARVSFMWLYLGGWVGPEEQYNFDYVKLTSSC